MLGYIIYAGPLGCILGCNYTGPLSCILGVITVNITSKVTAPQDVQRRLVLQVYLGSNTLEVSAIHLGEIFVSRL